MINMHGRLSPFIMDFKYFHRDGGGAENQEKLRQSMRKEQRWKEKMNL